MTEGHPENSFTEQRNQKNLWFFELKVEKLNIFDSRALTATKMIFMVSPVFPRNFAACQFFSKTSHENPSILTGEQDKFGEQIYKQIQTSNTHAVNFVNIVYTDNVNNHHPNVESSRRWTVATESEHHHKFATIRAGH